MCGLLFLFLYFLFLYQLLFIFPIIFSVYNESCILYYTSIVVFLTRIFVRGFEHKCPLQYTTIKIVCFRHLSWPSVISIIGKLIWFKSKTTPKYYLPIMHIYEEIKVRRSAEIHGTFDGTKAILKCFTDEAKY